MQKRVAANTMDLCWLFLSCGYGVMIPSCHLIFGLGLACLLAGCSDRHPTTYPVHGVVKFTDGTLLRDGTVEFELLNEKNSVTATGEIMPDGTFMLGTYKLDDGALPGKHQAIVISDTQIGTGAERPGLIAKSKLHPKYREFRTADLEFSVNKGTNNFLIEVEYAPVPDDTGGS